MYLEPRQMIEMELFAKIVIDWGPLAVFTKISIFDVWLGSQYASALVYIM